MQGPRFVDLFAGCGGLSLGMQRAGWNLALAVEAHADAFSTFRHNLIDRAGSQVSWPSTIPCGPFDIGSLLENFRPELHNLAKKVDLVVGGPPCQGFSTNGKRQADDPRNSLVLSYLEVVEILSPKILLIENVRGFTSMSHKQGGTYASFVTDRLREMDYDVFTQLVTAAEWGIPQRRPRFLLIATRKGALAGVDPFARLRTFRRRFLAERDLGGAAVSTRDALSDLEVNGRELIPDPEFGSLGFQRIAHSYPDEFTPYQNFVRDGFEGPPSDLRLPRHGATVKNRFEAILATCPKGRSISIKDRARLGIRKRSTTPMSGALPSPTVTTLPDDMIHYSEPRILTVRELARLQSFPDWFEFKGPYTSGGDRRRSACPRYTQVGNAVPPMLSEAVGELLLGLLPLFQPKEGANPTDAIEVSGKVFA